MEEDSHNELSFPLKYSTQPRQLAHFRIGSNPNEDPGTMRAATPENQFRFQNSGLFHVQATANGLRNFRNLTISDERPDHSTPMAGGGYPETAPEDHMAQRGCVSNDHQTR